LDKSRTILTTTAAAPAWAEDLKLTPNQVREIGFVNAARIAGSDDRCPRFHLIEAATFSELAAAGITKEMSRVRNSAVCCDVGCDPTAAAEADQMHTEIARLFGVSHQTIVGYNRSPSSKEEASW